ncbi:hypothetical protein ANCDUO_02622 [Ancylostoma duodenale]|uniref:Biogenesis of lysosome-related organelles complex 1 subunit 5 n=1 Tax=Ancylostoma duodenale TaxID=51022 RepID=A0A0C2H694_9BILA|nr:hypothetical protein ANCDUO_02622 [Ancylostoma duodenale]
MSLPTVMRDTQLLGQHLFDHTPYVRAEIDRFLDRCFFRKRLNKFLTVCGDTESDTKESFSAVFTKSSSQLIEAAETPVEALFDAGKMSTLTQDVNQLTERIQKLTQPTYAKEHEEYLAEIEKKQKECLDLRRAEAHLKLRNSIS